MADDADTTDGEEVATVDDVVARALVVSRARLNDVVTADRLDHTWKRVLRRLRVPRLPDLALPRDPLEWAAAEWDWPSHRQPLTSAVRSRRYRPQIADEFRGAKSKGLTRAMSHLALDDQVLYLLLIQETKGQLMALTEPWTRSGRQDDDSSAEDVETPDAEYSSMSLSWFDRWLAGQKTIAKILEDCELIVETDISNFFASAQLEVLRSRLAVGSTLDHEGVELLCYIISQVGPVRKHQRSVSNGLPVEDHDCSRTLAHFLLAEVDAAFEKDGAEGHYTRFVDDIAFGAESEADAKRKLARFEDALDRIGLYPNISKTRWFTREQWEKEYHREENDLIGDSEELLDGDDATGARALLAQLVPMIVEAEFRGRGWDRVLRRVSTVARRARSNALIPYVPILLWDCPSAARHLLEYAASFPVSAEQVSLFSERFSSEEGIYEDIDSLLFEFLSIAPVSSDAVAVVRSFAAQTVKSEFGRRPLVSASAAACLAKYSSSSDLAEIEGWADSVIVSAFDSPATRTVASVLHARRDWVIPRQALRRSTSLQRCQEFLSALRHGDGPAVEVARRVLALSEKKDPTRLVARARSLLLLPAYLGLKQETWKPLSDSQRLRYAAHRDEFPDVALEARWQWEFV